MKKYDPELHPKLVMAMVANGALEKEIITALNITKRVFDIWYVTYPEFAAALVIGDDISLANARVERSLFEMANGYEMDAVKIFNDGGDILKVPYKEQVPKNFNAAKYWLSNRSPDKWAKNDDGINKTTNTLNVNMVQSLGTEELQSLLKFLKGAVSTPSKGMVRLDTPLPVEDLQPVPDDASVTEESNDGQKV